MLVGKDSRTDFQEMKLLVIGSCTGDKNSRDCPSLLSEADFDDREILSRKRAELDRWKLPAAQLYTGWQHKYMMRGVAVLRHRFGDDACSVSIISAGYGLVAERQSLVPYEMTFQGKGETEIRKRAKSLQIPFAIREVIQGFEAVLFLLGKEYLSSVDLPLESLQNQKLIYFTSNSKLRFGARSIVVPAGKPETRFGAGTVALKGKMFELFAYGLAKTPAAWRRVLLDPTPKTVLSLMESGWNSA